MENIAVKEKRDIETEELTGYIVDGTKSVPLDWGNRDYQEIQVMMRGWYDEEVPVMEEYTETTYTYDDDGNATEVTTVKERQAVREITETVKDPEGNEVTVVIGTEPIFETRRVTFEPIVPEPAYTAEERQAYLANKMKQDYMNAIDNLIQAKIDEYNEANMVAFKNIDACAKYTAVPSYAHYQFCVDVIAWQTSVWEVARAIMADVVAGNRTPPSLDDFLAELPVMGA